MTREMKLLLGMLEESFPDLSQCREAVSFIKCYIDNLESKEDAHEIELIDLRSEIDGLKEEIERCNNYEREIMCDLNDKRRIIGTLYEQLNEQRVHIQDLTPKVDPATVELTDEEKNIARAPYAYVDGKCTGGKIQAIIALRRRVIGLGLKDAKDIVDNYCDGQ